MEIISVDNVTREQYEEMRWPTEAFSANCSVERLRRMGEIEDFHCPDVFDINRASVFELKESDVAVLNSYPKEEWDEQILGIVEGLFARLRD